MNSTRAGCLKSAPERAAKLLRKSYDNVFTELLALVSPSLSGNQKAARAVKANPFTVAAGVARPTQSKKPSKPSARGRTWMDKLAQYIDRPGDFPDAVFAEDNNCVIIHDKFKKVGQTLVSLRRFYGAVKWSY